MFDGGADPSFPLEITHIFRAMRVTVDKGEKEFTLLINGVNFNELEDAPARDREPLARSKTSINMRGNKKHGYYPLLCNGVLIPVSVMLKK